MPPKKIGRVGEHFAAFLLEGIGLETLRVDGTGCDLHVTSNSGRVLRVEVKTCSAAKGGSLCRFHIGKSDSEIFAFCSLVGRPLVRFFLRADAPKWTMNLSEFTLEAQQADLEWLAKLK